ncbi:hypothetical protein I3760_16G023300 [Carya illinoinensis]|nr:hypothetical protein I3760_16G023300 [Carya illinoinensis]
MEKMEGLSSLSRSRAFYAPLLRAALEDDWKAAETFIEKYPNCVRAAITKEQGTVLHNAAAAKRTRFVKKLVKLMTPEELELTTNQNCTALCFAAQSEIVPIAKEMVKRNRNLPSIFPKNCTNCLPLFAAIMTGNRDMVSYLYSVTPIEPLTSWDRIQLLIATISTDLYDTALKILDTQLAPEEKKLAPEEKKLTPEEKKFFGFHWKCWPENIRKLAAKVSHQYGKDA